MISRDQTLEQSNSPTHFLRSTAQVLYPGARKVIRLEKKTLRRSCSNNEPLLPPTNLKKGAVIEHATSHWRISWGHPGKTIATPDEPTVLEAGRALGAKIRIEIIPSVPRTRRQRVVCNRIWTTSHRKTALKVLLLKPLKVQQAQRVASHRGGHDSLRGWAQTQSALH